MSKRNSLLLVIALITAAAFTRLVPHLGNFTAVLAVSLLGGAWIKRRELAILVPMAAVFATDLFFGLYPNMIFVYASYAVIALVGSVALREKATPKHGLTLAGYGVGASLFFFLVTNFGAWLGNVAMYPQTFEGLMASYTAGIPFLGNTILGTLAYGAVMVMLKDAIESRVKSAQAA